MKVYMAVTADKYELPVVVADSPAELARLCGLTYGSVLSSISKGNICRSRKAKLLKIEIDDD